MNETTTPKTEFDHDDIEPDASAPTVSAGVGAAIVRHRILITSMVIVLMVAAAIYDRQASARRERAAAVAEKAEHETKLAEARTALQTLADEGLAAYRSGGSKTAAAKYGAASAAAEGLDELKVEREAALAAQAIAYASSPDAQDRKRAIETWVAVFESSGKTGNLDFPPGPLQDAYAFAQVQYLQRNAAREREVDAEVTRQILGTAPTRDQVEQELASYTRMYRGYSDVELTQMAVPVATGQQWRIGASIQATNSSGVVVRNTAIYFFESGAVARVTGEFEVPL